MGFDIRLPGLATIDFQLDDAEHSIDALRLLGAEDSATVTDERFGCAMLGNGRA